MMHPRGGRPFRGGRGRHREDRYSHHHHTPPAETVPPVEEDSGIGKALLKKLVVIYDIIRGMIQYQDVILPV